MIELYLTNSYGTTARALYVGTYDELGGGKTVEAVTNITSVEELADGQYEIYTLSGAKVNVADGGLGVLPAGEYIVKNRQNNKSWKKYIVR